MTEAQLREQIELLRQTEQRLWKKIQRAQKQRTKFEARLKELEQARLKREKENFPVTRVPEKASGKAEQERKKREAMFEEAMAAVKKVKAQRKSEGMETA